MTLPMKDSGAAWLGEVPVHWDVVPASALFTESKERARDGDQMLSATQKYGVIPLADFEEMEQRRVTKAAVNLEMRKHVEVGDFVISMRSMDGGLERARATGSVRSSYSVLKAGPEVEGRYFGALFKSSLYIQALRLTSNFIRDGQDLNFAHVKKVRLPKPRLEEQLAIADYLDRETARIDALIAKKVRFIELLSEKRQAVITYAVTKGLDASVQVKNSGVEWLGNIPRHWSVHAIKRIADGGTFADGDWIESKDLADDGIRYLTTGNIGPGFYKEQGSGFISEATFEKLNCMEVFPGDILISRLNLPIGRACKVPELDARIVTSVDNVIFRHGSGFCTDFLVYRLSSSDYLHEMENLGRGTTMQRISRSGLGEVRISIPPLTEQRAIVMHLDRITARIDALIAKTERSIELLREHRIALITAAVSGKIDSRETA